MSHNVRSDPGDLAPGDQVAGYRIQEPIGRGGMAVVYRALDLRLGRVVALKVLAPDLSQDEAFRERFMRESRAAAGVDHPHIVPVFEAGESAGVLFIAMQYVSGGDVRRLIGDEGRLSPARTAEIATQVASALDSAHARGLVHRDVKPGNILLGQASSGLDHAYLSDFGLSKQSLAASTLTAAGQFLGTIDYVSPEQIQGQPVDGRADQYALACTVTEMLTGAPPFRDNDTNALMWAQLESAPPRLTERRPELSPRTDRVIARALAKSATDRYPTCREFAAALTAACTAAPERAVRRAARLSLGPPELARDFRPQRSPAQRPDEGWPAATVIAPGDRKFAAGGGREASAAAGPNGHVPRRISHREPELARNFLTPGAPEGGGWPGQPPSSGNASKRGTWPPSLGRRSPARGRSDRNAGRMVAVAISVAVFIVAAAGAAAYELTHRVDRNTPLPAETRTVTIPPRAGAIDPRTVVRQFFDDINNGRYMAAWQLTPQTEPYQKFRDGYAGTAHDTLTIDSVQGNTVTAELAALQTDGSVRQFAGTYTVTKGVISFANVHRIS